MAAQGAMKRKGSPPRSDTPPKEARHGHAPEAAPGIDGCPPTGSASSPGTARSPSHADASADLSATRSPSQTDSFASSSNAASASSSTFCASGGALLAYASPGDQGPADNPVYVLDPNFSPFLRLDHLPEEVLRPILSYLPEQDLCSVAQVCRRFRAVADDPELWRRLYKVVFLYDDPLLHPQPCAFQFQSAEGGEGDLPWKESFRQLYHGVHVRPGYQGTEIPGRKITYFDKISSALAFTKERFVNSRASGKGALIFIHAGFYNEEIFIDFNVALIGVAAKEANKLVVVEGKSASTVTLTEGANETYVGHLTLMNRDLTLNVNHEYCCIEISKSCSPTVDSCVIQNLNYYAPAVRVSGEGANPTMRKCYIVACPNVGLCIQNHAEGTYEDNEICHTGLTCIWVKDMANPMFRRNVVYDGDEVGVKVSGKARGIFEEIEVYNMSVISFEVFEEASPILSKSVLMSAERSCLSIHTGASGLFTQNKLFSTVSCAVNIETASEPTIKLNKILHSKIGVYIAEVEKCIIEENEITDCSEMGIQIVNSKPIIRKNKILRGKQYGIHVSDQSEGVLEENEIAYNEVTGLLITDGSKMKVERNRIHSGNVGVHFLFHGHSDLMDNYIFNNANYNVKIESASNPAILRNKIWGGGKGGVLISNKGEGAMHYNEISDNGEAGVQIENSMPYLAFNNIFGGRGCGVRIVKNSKAYLFHNDILGNLDSGVLICSNNEIGLLHNRIYCGYGSGIDIVLFGENGILGRNQIFSNELGGLNLASDVQPCLFENDISDNENAVEKAVAEGLCFHALSGTRMTVMQDYHNCRTCADGINRVCVNCSRVCHKKHKGVFVRRDKFLCDCGTGSLSNPCQLKEGQLSSPPIPPFSATEGTSSEGVRH